MCLDTTVRGHVYIRVTTHNIESKLSILPILTDKNAQTGNGVFYKI
jgi:hypothetical protein